MIDVAAVPADGEGTYVPMVYDLNDVHRPWWECCWATGKLKQCRSPYINERGLCPVHEEEIFGLSEPTPTQAPDLASRHS